MQPRLNPSVALVFGGTGAVGSQVVRRFAAAKVPTVFTWHRSEEKARQLAEATGAKALRLDLSVADATRAALRGLVAEGFAPNVLVHAAATNRGSALPTLTDEDIDYAHQVNCQSALVALQELAPAMGRAKQGQVVLVGALATGQSVKMPLHFAIAQGGLSALAMAAAKEFGPQGVLVNLVSLGVLDAGLSDGLAPALKEDYQRFSALRRLGRPEEAAAAICWLALENTYMSGRVMPVNGGV